MEMLPLPSGGGVSALLEWHRQVFPEGHELVGIEDNGRLYTLDEIKALEGQETKMDLKIQNQTQVPDILRSILGSNKPERSVQQAFFYGETYIAFADDGTGWILERSASGDYWKQLRNAGVPALPQGEAF
jgi:hypothetical protein